jgi:hypothetical protein
VGALLLLRVHELVAEILLELGSDYFIVVLGRVQAVDPISHVASPSYNCWSFNQGKGDEDLSYK